MTMRCWALLVIVLVLSACATQTRTVKAPAVPEPVLEDAWVQREALLRSQAMWSFTGRVAIRRGREGGSGHIEWSQQWGKAEIVLSAPVTRQSWRLTIDAEGARLDGLDGGPRRGSNAEALLRDASGLDVPVGLLGGWARGLLTDARLSAATWRLDAQGRLSHLEQDGWNIDYGWPSERYRGEVWMPSSIEAVKGDARMRLVIDRWTLP